MITRQLFCVALLFVGLCVPRFATFAESARASDRAPNIIFLMTDDQRWDTLGCMGNRHIETPHIDALAREGIVFENMFVTTSICATNRATVLTGQYARRHGIWDFATSLTPEQLDGTYCGVLKDVGYRVGFIGKFGVGQPPRNYFDFDRAWPGQGRYFVQVADETPLRYSFDPKAPGKQRHLTSVMGDQALEFLDSVPADKPFNLSISFKAAHVQDSYNLMDRPFQPDPELERTLYHDAPIPLPPTARDEHFQSLPAFLQNSEARLRWAVRFWGPARYQSCVKDYYRLISGVDRQVGRIVQKLEDRGLADNTVIIFTGDNGFFLGEHGLAGKWYPHEESIRVPLVIYDPRLSKPLRGQRRKEMVLSVDLAPTICDLAGTDSPDQMQGHSLVPLIQGKHPEWRTEWFYEHLFEHPRIPKSEAVRTERWKYMRFDVEPPWEGLYDLQNDPGETTNLANNPRYRPQLEKLREQLIAWRKRVE